MSLKKQIMYRCLLIFAIAVSFTTISRGATGPNEKLTHEVSPVKKENREEKWMRFWKAFMSAVNNKDIKQITALTSKDFYDGGGGTVKEWLEFEVFFSDQHFSEFKFSLKKGARKFKDEGENYKATGKNDSGDLFFEYKNEQWYFGGVVGD